jgi:hypothetical protein
MQRMQLTTGVSLLLAVSAVSGCYQFDGEARLDQTAEQQFMRLPGSLGITIRNRDRVWRYILHHGQLRKTDRLPAAPREAKSIALGMRGASTLAPQPDYDYRGPFLTSPDEHYLAASISLKPPNDGLPISFVIYESQGKTLVAEVKGERLYYIESLAWSPDSRYIAVMKKQNVIKPRGPLEILAAISGHPVPYNDYWLEVYDVRGDLVARSQIAKNVAGSWGEVIWLEK